jgi:hypothetical protein
VDDRDRKSVARVLERIGTLEAILDELDRNPTDLSHLYKPPLENIIRQDRRTVECVEKGEPFLASEFTTPVEIMTAMDVHWYFHLDRAFSTGGIPDPHIMEDLEAIEKMPLPPDMCTFVRLSFHYLELGSLPRPTAYIAMVHPCDSISSMHAAYMHHPEWRDIPMFTPDAPYHTDARSLDYEVDELKRTVDFITKHTGKTLDIGRLRGAVEETNKGYLLWQEYNDLRRSIPAPHGWQLPRACVSIIMTEGAGRPELGHLAWFEGLVADAESRVKARKPEVTNQKIRVLWFDFLPVFVDELVPWMEQEWGAFVAMDMSSNCPFQLIDTSTEESMFRGLAERLLQHPVMIRQSHGTADAVLDEMTRIVKDFKIDCVMFPAHMGHKDQAAMISLMSETCRGLGVPFLSIGMDAFDQRYTPVDQIKNTISRFLVGMGLA